MTKDEIRKRAEVMLAYADGETIEYWSEEAECWLETFKPGFYDRFEYRIKPKAREFWLRKYSDGIYSILELVCEVEGEWDDEPPHPNCIRVREVVDG